MGMCYGWHKPSAHHGFVIEGRWLNHQIDNYHTQNYSNDSDFPYAFAKKVIYQPLGCFLLMWIVFLTDSRMIK